MNFKPYPYQEPMIDWLVERDHAALFVFMGAGKTPCTLEALHRVGGKALVIAPLRVASTVWKDQVARWGYKFKVANLRTPEGMKAWEDGSADIYTVNFEIVSRGFLDKLKGMPIDTLIIDELSLCKSNTKRTKSIIKLRSKVKRVWGLTGTPSPNSLLDLFFPLKVIDGGERLGKFITHFKSTYFDSDHMGWKFTPKEGAVEKIQEKISDICLSVQSEGNMDIPDAEIIDVNIPLPSKVMKQYKELEKHLVIAIKDTVIDAQSAAVLVNKLTQMTAGIVYDEDSEPVQLHNAKHKELYRILSKNKPVLILTRYKTEMQAILDAFPQVEKFDEKRMDDWVAGKIPAWVCNIASISHGVDRIQHSCSTIVWMSLTYSLEQYLQTNARILRTGQKDKAKVYRILCEDTIDWVISNALENKADGQSTLMASIGMLQRANSSERQSGQLDKPRDQKTNDPLDFLRKRDQ